nr:hypothetical protein [Tanacetum cinerariifolium]
MFGRWYNFFIFEMVIYILPPLYLALIVKRDWERPTMEMIVDRVEEALELQYVQYMCLTIHLVQLHSVLVGAAGQRTPNWTALMLGAKAWRLENVGDDGDPVPDPTLYPSLAGFSLVLYFYLPRYLVCSSLDHGLQLFLFSTTSWLLIQMRIGQDALLPGGPLLAIVPFLATTYSFGPLSVNRYFLVLVRRPSIVVLPMLLLRLVGYGIFCRTKHIEIDIHFVRDLVVAGQARVLQLGVRCPAAPTVGEC